TKTRKGLVEKVEQVITFRQTIDEELYEDLEAVLIQADIGVNTTLKLMEGLRREVKERKITDPAELKGLLKEQIAQVMLDEGANFNLPEEQTAVFLVVGVNGVGKTTTIGKLAYRFRQEGKRVLIAAGDTFRAAAIDQLEIWGNRAGVDVISHKEGADPAAVVFDALQAARARRTEVLIVDTAGRLHTRVNLMEELKKIRRVMEREYPGAPHEVLLVLDATTGQNAIQQAKMFTEATGVTGIVLTKLDGTAKGGIVIAIAAEFQIPVKLIGIGEQMDDLRDFSSQEFVAALFD
ncbi:MAG: signal recognition particle-docking protein FtsY, partial [Syntrophomonadaceae bacterium]|nr:signal recognition particle-docking protein FtsY [Syntrophomonadaceae bacterium]